MDAHEKLVGWLFFEGLVVVPAVAAVAVFSLRKWIFPAFRNFPEDVYLNAVAYPSAAAVVGAVVGVGVSGFFSGDVLGGVVYVFAGLAIAVGVGGMIVRDRAKDEEKPLDSFSVEEWRRDLDYLRGLRRISGQERREFEERAR